jgi:hypothetical protein
MLRQAFLLTLDAPLPISRMTGCHCRGTSQGGESRLPIAVNTATLVDWITPDHTTMSRCQVLNDAALLRLLLLAFVCLSALLCPALPCLVCSSALPLLERVLTLGLALLVCSSALPLLCSPAQTRLPCSSAVLLCIVLVRVSNASLPSSPCACVRGAVSVPRTIPVADTWPNSDDFADT